MNRREIFKRACICLSKSAPQPTTHTDHGPINKSKIRPIASESMLFLLFIRFEANHATFTLHNKLIN